MPTRRRLARRRRRPTGRRGTPPSRRTSHAEAVLVEVAGRQPAASRASKEGRDAGDRVVALLRRRFFRSQFSYIIYAQFFGGIGFFNKEDSTRKGGTVQASEDVRENHSSRMKIPSSHRAAVGTRRGSI
jgi:hypothetical protein